MFRNIVGKDSAVETDDGTYQITIDSSGLGYISGSYGSLTPTTIGNYTITKLYSYVSNRGYTAIELAETASSTIIISVTRLDTEVSIMFPLKKSATTSYQLFTDSDIGKTIPLKIEIA